MKPLIVLPLSTSEKQQAELREAGYVPILCDSPEQIQVLIPGSKINADDILASAMHALSLNHLGIIDVRASMVTEMARRLKERENR